MGLVVHCTLSLLKTVIVTAAQGRICWFRGQTSKGEDLSLWGAFIHNIAQCDSRIEGTGS